MDEVPVSEGGAEWFATILPTSRPSWTDLRSRTPEKAKFKAVDKWVEVAASTLLPQVAHSDLEAALMGA